MYSCPIVILGGFLSKSEHYNEMKAALAKITGRSVYTVPVKLCDWLRSISASGWGLILDKLDQIVKTALLDSGVDRVVLVGHSSGGVMGRLYLSPEPFRGRCYAGNESVQALITLGSPNQNRKGSPMRLRVERLLPGAFFAPNVRYISVAGSAVLGRKRGSRKQRSAFRSYNTLSGKGQVWGDGLVPLPSALLEGACPIILEGVFHDPTRNRIWYGSKDAVLDWWERSCRHLEGKGD